MDAVAEPPVKRRRLRWLQVSLRGFLLLVLIFCVWLGVTVRRARRQEEIVRKVSVESRNFVRYAHELDDEGAQLPSVVEPGPVWLRDRIGDHFFFEPRFLSLLKYDDDLLREAVQLRGIEFVSLAEANDARLMQLREWKGLRALDAASPYVTRKGLEELSLHRELRHISVRGAWITDEDLKLLKPLKKLTFLNVRDTQVTTEGAAWIEKNWPGISFGRGNDFVKDDDAKKVRERLSDVNARVNASNVGTVVVIHLLGKESTDAELLRLSEFEKLQMIYLYDTSVTADGVRALQRLRPLVTVRPNLLGPAPLEIEVHNRLKQLGLEIALDDDGFVQRITGTDSQVSDDDFAAVVQCGRIRDIVCDSEELGDAAIRRVATLPLLASLELSNAQITDDGLLALRPANGLRVVTLRGNDATDAGLEGLAGKHNLLALTLWEIAITSDGLTHLETCSRLQRLDLSGAEFSPNTLAYFSRSTSLNSLHLDGSNVTDADLATLGSFPQLLAISLRDTAVTDVGLHSLRRFGNLRSVIVEETAVTEAGAESFSKMLPKCDVRH
jgi:hypothetical protein